MSSYFSQYAKAYVDMRLDLYTLYIVSKTPSVDKVVDILVTYNDLVNRATLPVHVMREISVFLQTLFTVFTNFQNNVPICVQAGADMLLPFQLTDSRLGFCDHFDIASSYVSQNQDTLSNASCIIS